MALDLNKEIISVIRGQMLALVNNDSIYSQYNIQVFDEQSFSAFKSSINPKNIYVIVHFGSGTIYAGSIALPCFFEVISEENSLVVSKNLLIEYGLTYNFKRPSSQLVSSGVFIDQAYTTPQTQSNYNEVSGGYRSLIMLNATYIVGENINAISSLTIDNENIDFISVDTSNTATPNTVDTGVNNGRTTSMNKFASFVLVLTLTSKSDSAFINKLDQIQYGTLSLNTTFSVVFTKNGINYTKTLRVLSPDFKQTKGAIPTYTVSLLE